MSLCLLVEILIKKEEAWPSTLFTSIFQPPIVAMVASIKRRAKALFINLSKYQSVILSSSK